MNKVQAIFGLEATQLFNPQLMDVKFLFDQRETLRIRTMAKIVKCRLKRDRLANCRDLMERRYLMIEIENIENSILLNHQLHRRVNKEAHDLEGVFYKNLEAFNVNRYKIAA